MELVSDGAGELLSDGEAELVGSPDIFASPIGVLEAHPVKSVVRMNSAAVAAAIFWIFNDPPCLNEQQIL